MKQMLMATLGVFYVLLITGSAGARIFLDRSRDSLIDLQDPDQVAELLRNLEETLQQQQQQQLQQEHVYSDVKRNIDLGFSRGFSGSQAAKHLMGLAAANQASGPGRKRRAASMMAEADRQD